MNLYEILLPVQDNDHKDVMPAHTQFRTFLLDTIGGYTIGRTVEGAWRAPDGKVQTDTLIPYRAACGSGAWRKIVARAFELFPDQECIFHAKLGEATLADRPALTTNDLAAIDHAAERQNRLTYECYLSGQMSEWQWTLHLAEDKGLADFYAERRGYNEPLR